MKKKILGTILSLMLMSQAFASIAVSPTRIEIDANKVRGNFITTAVDVKGDLKKPMRFKAYTGYFEVDNEAQVQMIEKSDDVHNIASKIKFVPSEFNVMPGKDQKVRINVTNIKQLPDGENRAMLYIEDVDPKNINLDAGNSKIGAQLVIKTRMGVPVYIDKGNVIKSGSIEYFNINSTNEGLKTDLKLVSTGNSRIRYQGKVQLISNDKLVDECTLENGVVAVNKYFVIKEPLTFKNAPSGNYIARAVISYTDGKGKKQTIKKDTNINIKGEM